MASKVVEKQFHSIQENHVVSQPMRRSGIPLVHPLPQGTPHPRLLQGTVSFNCYLRNISVDVCVALFLHKHYRVIMVLEFYICWEDCLLSNGVPAVMVC
jgi:hypothetical protein